MERVEKAVLDGCKGSPSAMKICKRGLVQLLRRGEGTKVGKPAVKSSIEFPKCFEFCSSRVFAAFHLLLPALIFGLNPGDSVEL